MLRDQRAVIEQRPVHYDTARHQLIYRDQDLRNIRRGTPSI